MDSLSINPDSSILVAHTDGDGIKISNFPLSQNYSIFIGPEGGFSPREIEFLSEKKAQKIMLGDRILRTETAGVVVGFFLRQRD